MQLSKEAQTLYKLHRKREDLGELQKQLLPTSTQFLIGGRYWSASDKMARLYDQIKDYALRHEDAVVELMLSDEVPNEDKSALLVVGHGLTMGRKDNPHLWERMARLRQHKDKLPEEVQVTLDWLERVHGW